MAKRIPLRGTLSLLTRVELTTKQFQKGGMDSTKTFFMHPDGSIEEDDVPHDELLKIAMSMYLGERCKFCGKTYNTLDDLKQTVWAGYHEHGRLACKECWDRRN